MTSLANPETRRAALAEPVIRILGARTHNLRDVSVDIPRNQLVVITGVSGSGKSSLAFDTLLAEGQRQYIDSLSVYSRQFFDQMQRPEVDLIEGLQPAVAIDQGGANHGPRSTVGTVTEVYDYLRLLYARAADLVCADCGAAISQQEPEEIQQVIEAMPEQSRVMILSPLVRGRKGKHADVLDRVRKAGFVRVRVDGVTYPIEDAPELAAGKSHDIQAVIDRVVIREGITARLEESVRLAIKNGDGVVLLVYQTPESKQQDPDKWLERVFNTRFACPDCKSGVLEVEPRTFSFNSPYGACPACHGMGVDEGFDPELVLPDLTLSLDAGAVAPWRGATAAAAKKHAAALEPLLAARGVGADKPLEKWPDGAMQTLWTGDGDQFPGLLMMLEEEFATTKRAATRDKLATFRGAVTCADCGGARLRPEALAARVGGRGIHEVVAMPIRDSLAFFEQLTFDDETAQVAAPLVREISRRLAFLDKAGAGYLTLARSAGTLSGGELQRVRLASGLGSGLVGVMYLLDEPSVGLHPRDNDRLLATLRELQRLGNTVIVVEHDRALMRAADWIIDVGPGAGDRGGTIVAEGTPDQLAAAGGSITGRYLAGESMAEQPTSRRKTAKTRSLHLEGATLNNLRDVSVDIPLGSLVCVTGVSGSGKSSLIVDTLAPALAKKLHGAVRKPGPYASLRGAALLDRVVEVDQSPIGRTPRSNAATYTGLFDEVRRVFTKTKLARQRGYKVGRFSFNVKGGRCEACQGQGQKKIEMNFLPDMYVTCDECNGARFNRQTLAVKYKDRSIAEVLAMPVDEAREFFSEHPAISRIVGALHDVGLGYLPLGQPSTTLSGGEAQRIKLADALATASAEGAPHTHTLYLLDEPTTGLHAYDVGRLLGVLQKLVDAGNSVLVIEHDLDVMRAADWIIDLGPEGGEEGGQVVATGTPEDIAACVESFTGQWLAKG
ncbi:UvrABC system protein A [Posidoniimonas polymericola]|uniref:UvrABC system protein A n=1 Tax=Posidoniimonas polymericola TaxID=2528002 RepID=A0A5C5YT11_9BACT|nr:excinuclease ABC subunit UvrA [Posidoniimonas polymericola]TWT78095.1 UvrABC system protein A [Posidoniimonas polymericola]